MDLFFTKPLKIYIQDTLKVLTLNLLYAMWKTWKLRKGRNGIRIIQFCIMADGNEKIFPLLLHHVYAMVVILLFLKIFYFGILQTSEEPHCVPHSPLWELFNICYRNSLFKYIHKQSISEAQVPQTSKCIEFCLLISFLICCESRPIAQKVQQHYFIFFKKIADHLISNAGMQCLILGC